MMLDLSTGEPGTNPGFRRDVPGNRRDPPGRAGDDFFEGLKWFIPAILSLVNVFWTKVGC